MSFQNPDNGAYGPWVKPGVIDESFPNAFQEPYRQIVGKVVDACMAEANLSDGAIIEIGSGLGALGNIINPHYAGQYTQTDRTPLFAKLSHERNPRLRSIAADIYSLPFKPNTASLVLAQDVFDILDQPEDAAVNIHKVLAPGGRFVHFHDRRPNIGNVVRNLRKSAEGELDEVVMLPGVTDALTHLRLIHPDTYQEARAHWNERTRKLMDSCAENVEKLDQMRVTHMHEIDVASRLAAEIPGVDTPTFSELFTSQTTTALSKAGFRKIDSGVLRATAEVSQNYLSYILPAEILEQHNRLPEAVRDNLLVQQPTGRFELRGVDPKLPSRMIRQIGCMSVIVAEKDSSTYFL